MARMGYLSEYHKDGLMNALGLEPLVLKEHKDVRKVLTSIVNDNFQVIFVSEAVYKKYQNLIDRYDADFDIAFIVLAGIGEVEQLGKKRLADLIEDAIGIKV